MPVYDVTITDPNWDASQLDNGSGFTASGTSLPAKSNTVEASRSMLGLYVPNIPIAPGGVATACLVRLTPLSTANDDANETIYFERTGNANPFDVEADIDARPLTAELVTWIQGGLGASEVETPDLTDALNEVLGLGSWAEDNAVCVIIRGRSDSSGNFEAVSYEGDTGLAASFYAEYTEPPAAVAATTWDRYKTLETSFEVQVYKGLVFLPRFYCDDANFAALPDNLKPYLRKAPVAKLSVTPRVQFVNQNFTWDISASRSPTSTINTFSVFFNGSPTDLTGQSWASAPKSGTMAYDTVGEYVVEAYVEDILGVRSQTNSIMIEVIDEAEYAYIGSTDGGVWVLVPGTDPVQANTGLSGDQLKVRALRVHPAYKDLPTAQQHIWIATADGVSLSTDGAQNWSNISQTTLGVPENAAGDSPAPVTGDLDQIDLAFDPIDPKRVYLVRTKNTAPKRAWLYWTDDYGTSWSNQQVSV